MNDYLQMPSAEAVELLVFELAGNRYALELSTVRQVVRAVLIAPLPGAPPVVEGLIDVRGDLVPVYDLRRRFQLPSAPLHPDQMIVIVWTGESLAAIRCDRADTLLTVDRTRISAASAVRHAGSLVSGAAQLADGPLLIHDPTAFLDQAEQHSLAAALAAAAPPAAGTASPAAGPPAAGPREAR